MKHLIFVFTIFIFISKANAITCAGAHGTLITGTSACTPEAVAMPRYESITVTTKGCYLASCSLGPCGNCCCSGTCWSCWGCTPATGGICDNGPLTVCSGEPTGSSTTYYCPGSGCTTACVPNSAAGCETFCCTTDETGAGHCSDGKDNDCDGIKDCNEEDCNDDPFCVGNDIGLRIFDGANTEKIATRVYTATDTLKLMTKKDGLEHIIITVSTTHSLATKATVEIDGEKWAMKKITPCVPTGPNCKYAQSKPADDNCGNPFNLTSGACRCPNGNTIEASAITGGSFYHCTSTFGGSYDHVNRCCNGGGNLRAASKGWEILTCWKQYCR